MGIITYIKIGVVVVLLAVGTFIYVNYNRMQNKIATLELVVSQQQQAIEFYQKAQEIDIDTAKAKDEFHQILQGGDHQKILEYFQKMRKLSEGEGRND